jgi:hypothetical protein
MKVYNPYTAREIETGQTFTQPSETIPDQTMSMRTILEKYAKGLPLGGSKDGIYSDDPENDSGIDPRTLDLVDIQRMKLENKEQVDRLTKKVEKLQKESTPEHKETQPEGQ